MGFGAREATRLGVSDQGPEVDGPGGEEEGEDVGSGERREDDERVSEVERGDGEQQPERVEREEGPEVEARRPVPPPQQVHALHRLAVHLEPRHAGAAAARIGESAAETPPGLSDRVPMWIRERDDTGGDLGRVYRLGSARLDGVRSAAAGDGRGRRWATAATDGGLSRRCCFAGRLCSAARPQPLRRRCQWFYGAESHVDMNSRETFPFPFPFPFVIQTKFVPAK